MASLINRNGVYYGQWSDASRTPSRRRHSLKTADKKTARQLLARADAAASLGEWDPWVDPVSTLDTRPADPVGLLEAVETFLHDRRGKLRPVTIGNYKSLLTRFAESVGPRVPLARIKPVEVEQFACAPTIRETTQRTRLVTLRSFFSWAVHEGHLVESAARRVETPQAPAALPRVVTEADLQRVLKAVRDDQDARDASPNRRLHTNRLWLVWCFEFAFYTGLRAAELSRMTWADVDLEKGRLRLEVQKNKKAGYLPLGRRAVGVLAGVERLGPGDHVFCPPCSRGEPRQIRAFSTNLNRYFRRYVKAAGIERRLTLHGLRHGFCTALAEAGATAFTIRAAARHSNVTTSQVYVAISGDALRSELDRAQE